MSSLVSGKNGNRFVDLTGRVFSFLTVVKRIDNLGLGKHSKWLCVCVCGETTEATATNLKTKHTTSCGCKRIPHKSELLPRGTATNKDSKRLGKIWRGIIDRVSLDSRDYFDSYGGRGITVCEEWFDEKGGFESFYVWALANGYDESLTIDRIDNDGHYEPGNCRWTTKQVQANNRRSSKIVTAFGETDTLANICRKYAKVDYKLVSRRIIGGFSVEDALTKPKRGRT